MQGRCIHMSCRYIWRRIRRTRKRKAGGWREAGVAVDRGGETFTGSACPPKRYLGEEDP